MVPVAISAADAGSAGHPSAAWAGPFFIHPPNSLPISTSKAEAHLYCLKVRSSSSRARRTRRFSSISRTSASEPVLENAAHQPHDLVVFECPAKDGEENLMVDAGEEPGHVALEDVWMTAGEVGAAVKSAMRPFASSAGVGIMQKSEIRIQNSGREESYRAQRKPPLWFPKSGWSLRRQAQRTLLEDEKNPPPLSTLSLPPFGPVGFRSSSAL